MSVNIPNPSYKLSEREDYRLIVESGGVACDCEIKSASWRFDKGSINNIFNVYPTKTGSITTDYDFYEGQELSFYYQGYEHSGFIGRFTVISVGETGTDSKTYQLEDKSNAYMNDNVPVYSDAGFERYFARQGLHYKDKAATSTAVMSALQICTTEEIDADFKVLYTPDYNKFSEYSYKDLMMLRNATLVDIDMFYHFNESDGDITIDNIRQSSESSTGFVRTGLDYVGITFTYIKQTKEINQGGNKSFEFENLMVTTYKTETVTEYFYYSDTEGFTHSQTKPNGNGIIYEYPFVVGEKNGENHYNNFINFVYGSFMQDFLTRIESTDLTPRSITIPFHPDYFDTGSYVRSYTIYDTDVYDLYGDENEELELTNEQYSAYVNSRKYKMPVFITTLNYNGAFSLELSTGEQFEGSNQNSTQSNSTINITTSTSQNVNIDSLMANISNLQKSISDLTTNFVNKVEFADTVAELMDASKINGSVLEDLTIDNSKFANGTIEGSKLVDSIFKDGKIQGSAIDTSTFSNGSITGSMIDNSTITNSILDNVTIDASKITSGTISADRIDSDAIATKVIESETLQTDIATIADARIKVATIEDAQIESINGKKIRNSAVLAKALSAEMVETVLGVKVYYQPEQPTGGTYDVGDVWYKTIADKDYNPLTDVLYVYNGTTWEQKDYDTPSSIFMTNSIVAQDIAANSITASKIDVEDLFSQNIEASGTITGASISARYLNVHEVIQSTEQVLIDKPTFFDLKTSYDGFELQSGRLDESSLSSIKTLMSSNGRFSSLVLESNDSNVKLHQFGVDISGATINLDGIVYLGQDVITDVFLGKNDKASSASSADSVAWTNVSGRPTNVSSFTNDSGYITGITKSMVTTALGYTPPTTNTTYSAGTGLSLSGTSFSVSYGNVAGTTCQGNDSRLSDSRKASDVYSWAKASSKPSYSWSEITSKPFVNCKYGSFAVTLTANTVATGTINFGSNFADTNYIVVATLRHNSGVADCYCKIGTKAVGSFTYYVKSTGAGSHAIEWIAIHSK